MKFAFDKNNGLTLITKKRSFKPFKSKKYFPTLSNWLKSGFPFSLFTAGNIIYLLLNLAFLAGASLLSSVVLSFASIVYGGYKLKQVISDLIFDKENRGRHAVKAVLMVTAAALLSFAMLTALAATPGVNLLFAGLFLFSAAALGLHFTSLTCDAVLPFLQRKGRELWNYLRGHSPKRETLSSTETKKLQRNQNDHVHHATTKTFFDKLHQAGLYLNVNVSEAPASDSEAPTSDTDALQATAEFRQRLTVFARSQAHRKMGKGFFSSVGRDEQITQYRREYKGLIGKTKPAGTHNFALTDEAFIVNDYLRRVKSQISQIANDCFRISRIREALVEYQSVGNDSNQEVGKQIEAAIKLLKLIQSGKGGRSQEGNITIDRLDLAINLLGSDISEEKCLKILKRYLILPRDFYTPKNEKTFEDAVLEIVDMAIKTLTERHTDRLGKLHLIEGLEKKEIEVAVQQKFQEIAQHYPATESNTDLGLENAALTQILAHLPIATAPRTHRR